MKHKPTAGRLEHTRFREIHSVCLESPGIALVIYVMPVIPSTPRTSSLKLRHCEKRPRAASSWWRSDQAIFASQVGSACV